jgi:hypothetical protein
MEKIEIRCVLLRLVGGCDRHKLRGAIHKLVDFPQPG